MDAVADEAVAAETVSDVPPNETVGFVAQLPVAFEQKPLPAIVNAVGVPCAEYVVNMEVIAGAAFAPADTKPRAAATPARIIPDCLRIFFAVP